MGTFLGHLLPGALFFLFGVWGSVCTWNKWLRVPHGRFRCSATHSCPCLGSRRIGKLPWEPMLKIGLTVVGILAELKTGFNSSGRFVNWMNLQHITMYFFFLLSGVVDLLLLFRCTLPRKLDYVTVALAFGVEGMLFKFHLHGRNEIDTLLHVLLVWAITGCVVGCLLEMLRPSSVLSAFTRHFCVLVQGTWFSQVGWILYPPVPPTEKWDPESNSHHMILTSLFAFHVAGNFLFLLLMGALIRCCHRASGCSSPEGDQSMTSLLPGPARGNGHAAVPLSGSESDTDFERPYKPAAHDQTLL